MVEWFEALVMDERGYGPEEDTAFREAMERRFERSEGLLKAGSRVSED
jgi:hypothetical protein